MAEMNGISRWISVVFLPGPDARYVLSMIERRGAPAAIEYLRNWDHGKWTTDDSSGQAHDHAVKDTAVTERMQFGRDLEPCAVSSDTLNAKAPCRH